MEKWGWEYMIGLVADQERTTCSDIRLNYSAVAFMNIACMVKDKRDNDNSQAKKQMNKIRTKYGR